MDFQSLVNLITIAEVGSISRAAEVLFTTEPSLSRFNNKIERQLGFKLFYRKHDGVELTPAGQHYLEFAKRTIQMHQETLVEINNILSSESSNAISVGISSMWSSILLPKILPVFYRDTPTSELNIHNETSHNLAVSLLRKQLDVAIITLPISSQQSSNITYHNLFQERILIAIPRKHPVCRLCEECPGSQYKYIAPKYLSGQSFILSNINHRLLDSAQVFFEKEHITPKIVMREDSVHIAKQMVAQNFGLAFINESATKIYEVPSDDIVYCITSENLLDWSVAIAWVNNKKIERRIEPFLKATLKALNLNNLYKEQYHEEEHSGFPPDERNRREDHLADGL